MSNAIYQQSHPPNTEPDTCKLPALIFFWVEDGPPPSSAVDGGDEADADADVAEAAAAAAAGLANTTGAFEMVADDEDEGAESPRRFA